MSNKLDIQPSPKWIYVFAGAAILITIVTAGIGWATNNYNWHMPLMNFTIGICVVTWFAAVAAVAVHCVKLFLVRALKAFREKVVADTMKTLKQHEADQWTRAARGLSAHVAGHDG